MAQDANIDPGGDRSSIRAEARAACSATLDGFAKALNHIGLSRTALVLQGNEETACMRRVVAVVLARPGVDVKNSGRRSYHVAGVTNVVSEDRGAKNRGEMRTPGLVSTRFAPRLFQPHGVVFWR